VGGGIYDCEKTWNRGSLWEHRVSPEEKACQNRLDVMPSTQGTESKKRGMFDHGKVRKVVLKKGRNSRTPGFAMGGNRGEKKRGKGEERVGHA